MLRSKLNFSVGMMMIARDSSGTIERALSSVSEVCSQLLVVDTGSTDRTPAIAASMGAEVLFFRWVNDFAAARNFALQFMRTDWIVVLDSDEELDQDSFTRQYFLANNPYCGGIKVNLINYLEEEGEQVETTHKAVRLFRNQPGAKYEGSIHEQVSPSILDTGMEIIDSEIRIKHYGYSDHNEKKFERNKALLLAEIEKHPDDDWLKYHLAETEFAWGNIYEAEKLFVPIAGSRELDTEQQELTGIRLGQINLAKGDTARGREALSFISKDKDREGLRLFVLGAIAVTEGKYSEAEHIYYETEMMESAMVGKKQLMKNIGELKKITGG